MRNIATIPARDREALFRNTAAKMGMSEAIIEKDFWVCYMLDYLFHRCAWKSNLAFKGGTSLSKAYGLIERFSEDIDLILDWRVLGYGIIDGHYKDFEDRFALVETKLPALETVRRATMNKSGRFSKQDIRELCPSLSISSIEGALRKMVAEGELKREGNGKNIRYFRLK